MRASVGFGRWNEFGVEVRDPDAVPQWVPGASNRKPKPLRCGFITYRPAEITVGGGGGGGGDEERNRIAIVRFAVQRLQWFLAGPRYGPLDV